MIRLKEDVMNLFAFKALFDTYKMSSNYLCKQTQICTTSTRNYLLHVDSK